MTKLREKLSLVPAKPGVYLMRDVSRTIIYIGKAKSLKSRLSSYFKSGSHDAKVTAMLARVCDFDYFITKTENDALGMEANLVKKHQPHYNVLLKDSKSFPYIKVVDAPYPYLEVTRKLTRGGKYFGPYFNGIWANELLDTLLDIFPVRTCLRMPKTPCLNYQIERCKAPCANNISREDYQKLIADVKSFLRGEREFGARELLMQKMERAAELEQFELAIRYRNGIDFLDKLKERTITQIPRDVNCDVFAHATSGDIVVFCVLTIRAGKLIGAQNFSAQLSIQSEQDMVESFVGQYYQNNKYPDEVVFGAKIGYKKQLVDMAKANAEEYLEKSIEQIKFKREFTVGAVDELGSLLGMKKRPKRIECFDISHTGGEDTVASMAVFIDGVADKKLYRRFKIKHGLGNNDVASMREVIKRRLARIGAEDGFGQTPDLIVIDGGKGQLGVVMDYVGMGITFIALAKENEEIFTVGLSEPIILSKRSYALRLLQRVRDEAHRFAGEYHRKLRNKL